jgi:4-amino-4-deoxy-L-arabinose transferase-like glycosyltransferase
MKKYALHIVIILTAVASIYAFFKLLMPLDVFLWDESHHGFYGMQIYNDLKALDPGSFWAHTNNQALWMPLHSWFDGVFLLLFGFSYTSARLSSLFLFFVCSILIYFISLELSKEKGWIIGLTAALFYLTSPAILHLGTVNMQEMLGIFVCLVTVYFIVRNINAIAIWKPLTIGFLLSVAYWAKQNYAMVTVFGVFLFQMSLLWDARKSEVPTKPAGQGKDKKRPSVGIKKNKFYSWILDNVLIIVGFLPLFVLWWIMPPFQRKYGLAVTFRQGSVAGMKTSVLFEFFGTAAFYIQSFITSYNLSFWVALGCLAAVIASFFFFRDKKIRVISLMFCANLIFISIMSFAQERYLATAAPLAFILLGYFGLAAFERLANFKKTLLLAYILLALIAASFAYDLAHLTEYTREVANRSIMSFIYPDALNRFSPPFLFGLAKRPAFTYPKDFAENKYKDFKVPPRSKLSDVLQFFTSNMEKNKSVSTMISTAHVSPYVIYWNFRNWGANVFTVNDLGLIGRYFWISDYFIDLDISPDSPYYPDVYEKRWKDICPVLLRGGYIKLAAKKEFSDLGLTAKIYKREGFINFQ